MKNIVIIGAGPAGITAGYELAKTKQYAVTILEKSDRIGGLSCSISHNGNYMDLGGHRFFSKSERVNLWWKEILGDDLLVRKRLSRIYYKGKFFDYPISFTKNTITGLGAGDLFLSLTSYLTSRFHKRPETSLENFYINRFGRHLYEMFFKNYTQKVWGISPAMISADWGSQRVKGLDVSAIIKDMLLRFLHIKSEQDTQTSLIEEFYYPKYGPGQMWSTALEKFEQLGGKLIKNCHITDIIPEGNHIESVICDGKKLPIDILLSSMPLGELACQIGTAPNALQTAAHNLAYRDFITIGFLLDKKALTKPLNDCWIYIQDKSLTLGRIQIFNNWSPYLVANDSHVWMGLEYFCSKGDSLWQKSEKEFMAFAKEELLKTGLIKAEYPVMDFHIEKVEKAYPAYWGAYQQLQDIQQYMNQFHNLYCIGRNGQHRYNNMDHSMLTAFYAVDHIHKAVSSKEDIWLVNTEKTYN